MVVLPIFQRTTSLLDPFWFETSSAAPYSITSPAFRKFAGVVSVALLYVVSDVVEAVPACGSALVLCDRLLE